MITLSKLVEVATTHTPNGGAGIQKVLGDGYLYANNPVFRDVRDKALAFGYSYIDRDCDLWRDYQVCALVTLPLILQSKMIPFLGNLSVIARLAGNNERLAVPAHFLLTSLKKNYLLHESGHAVSHAILQGQDYSLLGERTEEERFALQALLCESFANTSEKLASAVANESVHALLFTLNSYILFNRSHIQHLRNALRISGAKAVFLVGFLLYFASNTSGDGLQPADRDAITSLLVDADCFPGQREAADLFTELSAAGFNVNADFREETTPLFLELCGHGELRSDLQDFGVTNNGRNLATIFNVARVFADAEHTALSELDNIMRTLQ